MFHVSSLIPSKEEKERLFKTDRVAIVYSEAQQQFDPTPLGELGFGSFVHSRSRFFIFFSDVFLVISLLTSSDAKGYKYVLKRNEWC